MQQLTTQGQQIIKDLAQRYGVSDDAVMTLLQALIAGNGTMAQFSHPAFGGSGQWMQGGMTMVGDLFNHALKATVDGLCSELSALLATQPVLVKPLSSQSQSQGGPYSYGPEVSLFVPSAAGAAGQWWPAELGTPSATGAQNNIRYAYFPAARRLAIDINGHITVYDTLHHQIGGVSQQQSADASLTFTSQFGLVPVANLPVIAGAGVAQAKTETAEKQEPAKPAASQEVVEDIITKIERLAKLRQTNILSEEEFAAKKAELLSRL